MPRPEPPVAPEWPFDAGASPTDRWRALAHVAGVATLVVLVLLAVVLDRLAAKGVVLIAFVSMILAYLIAPLIERIRRLAARALRGRRIHRGTAVGVLYACIAVLLVPIWYAAGPRLAQVPDLARAVPGYVGQFLRHVRESERWHERFTLPPGVREPLQEATRRASQSVQREVRELEGELAGARRLLPWLALVPVISFLLVTRWQAFRRSAARVMPTPHLQWRGDELLRQVNAVLAAYTRAQAISAVIVAVLCGVAFALLRVPNAAMLGVVAGLLELIPLAGPIAAAITVTAVAPDRAVPLLAFLAGLRVLQDYVIYPRLIRRTMHLHPIGVIAAIWIGAAFGGLVGVCLAIPVVGVVQVALRHWREYRDIERLVRTHHR